PVGTATPLRSLSVSGTTDLNGGAVSTTSAGGGTGNQTYMGPVALGANTTLTATGGTVAFSSTVSGNFSLTTNATAGLTFPGNASFSVPIKVDQGTLSPSPAPDVPGILTAEGVSFSPGTGFQVALAGTTPGTGFSQLVSTGPVSLTNTALLATLNFTPAVGDQFTIVRSTSTASPITGLFTDPTGRVLHDG